MHLKKYLLLLPLLAACEQAPAPTEPLRPVKTMRVIVAPGEARLDLPGEVRARFEAPLSFRVGGKITACEVNLGDTVHRGKILARLEPADYKLAAEAGEAEVREAKSAFMLAQTELTRYRSLREKGFVSAAMLDQKQAAADSAQARLDALQSSHAEQGRQLAYTGLEADSDGVISGYDCNVGQVVAIGQPVMKLARSGAKEIWVNVPEAELQLLRHAAAFSVSLNAAPGKAYQGALRELAAAADPATRTYPARITVLDADAAVQLGMSATVAPHLAQAQAIRLPLSAIVSRDGKPSVWKVDEAGLVHQAAIMTGDIEGNTVRVAAGLNGGDVVVTAGVNLLRDGEKVKLP
jgi:multidrug efflux system membrane fusion protein